MEKLPETINKIPTTELFIDATPDDDYPVRILKHFKDRAREEWLVSGLPEEKSWVYDKMNEAQKKRYKILNDAIECLGG